MVYRLAAKMIQQPEFVDDIVQDVFLALHEKLSRKIVINYLKSWLYRTTYNKCVDFIKQNQRYSTLEDKTLLMAEFEPAENNDKKELVSKAINKLNPELKFLIVLYSEGLSYKEMSEATGIKMNSIGKTLSRTLKKLKNEMKEEYYELHK